jgi:hypothetical protein
MRVIQFRRLFLSTIRSAFEAIEAELRALRRLAAPPAQDRSARLTLRGALVMVVAS